MRVSDKGLAEIAGHEGIVLSRYKDSVGVWTIGIGHTKNAGAPDPVKVTRVLTIPDVMAIFRDDIKKFERRVSRAVTVPLKQHEFDALVSFDFNTGGIHRAKLTSHLNAGDRTGAARAFMGWVKPPEIKPRRRAEQKLFRTGDYGDGKATVYPATSEGRVRWSVGRRVNVLELMTAPSNPPPPDIEPISRPPGAHPKQSFLATLFGWLFRIWRK